MSASAHGLLKNFAASERGSVVMMFGLMAIGLFLSAGVAIDFGRLSHVKTRLSAAADAAALAGGRALLDGRLSNNEIETLTERVFMANINNGGGAVSETFAAPTIDVNRGQGIISIDALATVPMTIMKVAGFNSIDIPISAATKFDQRDVELAMALDLTGSMSGQKIRDLKDATKDMIDILLPNGGTPNQVRIAFAPYSSGVNAGRYAYAATGQSTYTCTYEREGYDPLGDQAPGPGDYLKTRGDAGVNPSATCPTSSPVVPLSNDKAMLKSTVDGYTTGGSTAGHLGAQWAWYLISPEWNNVFGGTQSAPYNDGQTIKAIVLMTDGVFNTIGGTNYGDYSSQGQDSRDWTVQMCSSMRNHSIRVYTVGFALDSISNSQLRDGVRQTLQDCAGQSDRFFNAEDGQQLRAAFSSIAQQLNNLRLTN